jgi:hypothetical protein
MEIPRQAILRLLHTTYGITSSSGFEIHISGEFREVIARELVAFLEVIDRAHGEASYHGLYSYGRNESLQLTISEIRSNSPLTFVISNGFRTVELGAVWLVLQMIFKHIPDALVKFSLARKQWWEGSEAKQRVRRAELESDEMKAITARERTQVSDFLAEFAEKYRYQIRRVIRFRDKHNIRATLQRRERKGFVTAGSALESRNPSVDGRLRGRTYSANKRGTASVPTDHDDDRVQERWVQSIQPHQPQAIDVTQFTRVGNLRRSTTSCWRRMQARTSQICLAKSARRLARLKDRWRWRTWPRAAGDFSGARSVGLSKEGLPLPLSNFRHGYAFPFVRTIGIRTGLSKTTVEHAIGELERASLLTRVHRYSRRGARLRFALPFKRATNAR